MKVQDLLNPAPKEEEKRKSTSSVPVTRPTLPQLDTNLSSMSRPTKVKHPKDAPIFRKGPTKGDVLFPPYEAGDDQELAIQFERHRIFPRGDIAEYCHHIPYSSDKKTFLSKTGRDAFEVFQYTFKLPGDEKEYTVMWDYNIGLVRVTPFFKARNFSKTTPAKCLGHNPGLRDVTHSITGGALTAQGYWMPFACARAVAANFCYNFCFALVPIFGKDFPNTCIPLDDPMHGSFRIDSSIIKECTAETRRWLTRPDARLSPSSSRKPSEMPATPRSVTALPVWKKLKPRKLASASSPESGYETSTETSAGTPNLSPKAGWAAVNKPRQATPQTSHAEVTAATSLLMLSSPKASATVFTKEIPRSVSTYTTPEKRSHEESDGESEESPLSGDKKRAKSVLRKEPVHTDAAITLLQLMAGSTDVDSDDEHRDKRQRCSSVP